MTEDQGFRIGDLRSIVKRRLPIMAAVSGTVFLLAIFVASILPNVYMASVTLLIEPQSISKKLVEAGIAESDLNNRLHLMTMQILSRARLSKIIDDLKLYPEESERMTREEVIELMRSKIRVEPVLPELESPELRRNRAVEINTFRLYFQAASPRIAAEVANRLASDFIDEHIRERVQVSGDTSEFIEAELQRLASRIREVEAQTAQIKTDNPGRLPEDMEVNRRLLERAIDNLRDAQRDLAQAQSDEAFYRQQSLQAAAALPSSDEADPSRRIEVLKLRMNEYRSRGFTEKHPDIVSTTQEIAALEQRIASEGEDAGTPSRSLPQQQAEAEMRRANLRVQGAQQDIARLQTQVDEIQERLVATPRVEEQLASLGREYENLSENFAEYSTKRLEANTQANMERRQKGEQFRVLESAVPPPEPTSPKRIVIVLVGFLLAIAIGGGAGLLLEGTDRSFHGGRDLQHKLRIPVLAEIPAILLDADRVARRRRNFRVAIATAGLVLLVLVGSGGGYFYVNVLPGWRNAATEGAAPPAAPAPSPPAAGGGSPVGGL